MRILFKVLYEMTKPPQIHVQLTKPTLKKITKTSIKYKLVEKNPKPNKRFKEIYEIYIKIQ